ncbi:MAG: hypothetical protein EA355_14720 [Rhodobacteraceae bacterium]|nr:MAG: hypothetical protein EA355_14720 [Paracoccaceae bacterium]
MRISFLAFLLTAATLAAAEETPVSTETFRAYAEGWTLYFEEDGEPFGAEAFRRDGTVTWKPEGGPCIDGVWGGDETGRICFLYPEAMACWRITRDGDGKIARMEDGSLEIRIVGRDRRPLVCGDEPAI